MTSHLFDTNFKIGLEKALVTNFPQLTSGRSYLCLILPFSSTLSLSHSFLSSLFVGCFMYLTLAFSYVDSFDLFCDFLNHNKQTIIVLKRMIISTQMPNDIWQIWWSKLVVSGGEVLLKLWNFEL